MLDDERCKPFWNYIWEQAQQSLGFAEKIVIIGYSMPNADERARELLLKHSNPNAEILVFSGSRTGAICEDFRKIGFQTVNSFGDGYFEDYLRGRGPLCAWVAPELIQEKAAHPGQGQDR